MTDKNNPSPKTKPKPLALGVALGALVSVVTGSPVFLGVGLAVGAALKKRWEREAASG